MIRVTLNNKEIIESETLKDKGWYVFLDNADYRKTEIIKIEKQVKDLTLDECKKLGLCGVDLYKGGVWFNELMKEHIDYYDDDYIDITKLLKEDLDNEKD